MNTSIEKQQGSVSNGNCYLRSKVAKNINQLASSKSIREIQCKFRQ